jgi:hypothetical protein
MPMRPKLLAMFAAVAVLLTACHSKPKPPVRQQKCPGDYDLTVRNNLGERVDIYMRINSRERFIGSSSPGVSTMTVPAGTLGYFHASRGPGRNDVGSGPDGARDANLIMYEVRCAP